jgi:hypothetical protein
VVVAKTRTVSHINDKYAMCATWCNYIIKISTLAHKNVVFTFLDLDK